MLALLGGGAIVGTVLLAPFRARVHTTRFVTVIMPAFALCLLGIGFAHVPRAPHARRCPSPGPRGRRSEPCCWRWRSSCSPAGCGRAGWRTTSWPRRAGWPWGRSSGASSANRLGVTAAFTIAALAVLPTWVVALPGRFPEVSVAGDAPAGRVPDHDLADDMLHRRARVAVTWSVPEEQREAFLDAMREVKRSRRRTGGREWSLAADVETPMLYVETFTVDSWHDHLEQHEVRQSPEDAEASAAVRALVGPPVEIRHYVEVLD